jgi:ribonuclease Y
MPMNPIVIVIAAILDVLVVIAAYLIGGKVQKDTAEKSATGARLRAEGIIQEANREAEIIRKKSELEARDEWYKAKQEFEKETQNSRREIQALERKTAERESGLTKRVIA